MPLQFAPSVPTNVRDWATEKCTSHAVRRGRNEVVRRIARLVGPESEVGIWRRVRRLCDRAPTLDPLWLAIDTVTLPEDWNRLSKSTRGQVVRDAEQLQRSADRLSKQISLHIKPLVDRDPMVNDTLSLLALASQKDTVAWTIGGPEIKAHIERFLQGLDEANLGRYFPNPPALLRALGESLVAASKREQELLPTRMNARTAGQTYGMHRLHRHIKEATGEHQYALVADLVNVTFNINTANEDLVRRNTASRRRRV
jgi:hypothetical protein